MTFATVYVPSSKVIWTDDLKSTTPPVGNLTKMEAGKLRLILYMEKER